MTDEPIIANPEQFLFNDYFSDPNDRGMEITVYHDGRWVPFRIRRALTLKEKQAANNAAIKIEFDEKGKPNVTRMDQAAFTERIVLAALTWWPFTYADGSPVPINRDTVAALDEHLNEEIANKALKLAQAIEEAQQVALDPFVPPLEENS